jgi:hypothetical protein
MRRITPVSLDRLLAQDREVQATTPCLGVAAPSVHRPRLTMTGLQGGQAQHIADRAQIPLAPPYTQAPVTPLYRTLPVRHPGPRSTPSKPVNGTTRPYRAVTYSFYVLLVKNVYQS